MPDTVDPLVRTARTFVHHYNSTNHCKTDSFLYIPLPADQHHITDVAKWSALDAAVNYPPFASIAKGEVFGLLYVCLFVRQRFLDNPRADSRQSSHAGVLWFRMCLLPFWGLAAPGGRKKGQMKLSLL